MTNEEAINIIQTSNDKLAAQIESLKHGATLLDDRDNLYQCLEYCRKEYEACNIAIEAMREKAERENPKPLGLDELNKSKEDNNG